MPAVAAKESWKPGSQRSPGRQAQEREHRERQRVRELGLALEQDAGEQEQPHHGGAQHGGWPPTTSANPMSTTAAAIAAAPRRGPTPMRQREHRGRQQRHVEARHREDVVDAGAPEVVVDLAGQGRALAEQQARQQRGRGLGQSRGDDATAQRFTATGHGGVRR